MLRGSIQAAERYKVELLRYPRTNVQVVAENDRLSFWPGNPGQQLMGSSTSHPFWMGYPSTCTMGMATRASMILSDSMYDRTIGATGASQDKWNYSAGFLSAHDSS